jgi:hypothetical protein
MDAARGRPEPSIVAPEKGAFPSTLLCSHLNIYRSPRHKIRKHSWRTLISALPIENVPADLHQRFRLRARKNRKFVAAELISLLEQTVPTAKKLKRREAVLQ